MSIKRTDKLHQSVMRAIKAGARYDAWTVTWKTGNAPRDYADEMRNSIEQLVRELTGQEEA